MADLLRPDLSPFGVVGADAAAPRWLAAALCGFPADWHCSAEEVKEVTCCVNPVKNEFSIVEDLDMVKGEVKRWLIPFEKFHVVPRFHEESRSHELILGQTSLVINFDPWKVSREDDTAELSEEMERCAQQDEEELAKFLFDVQSVWQASLVEGMLSPQMWEVALALVQAKRLLEKGRLSPDAFRGGIEQLSSDFATKLGRLLCCIFDMEMLSLPTTASPGRAAEAAAACRDFQRQNEPFSEGEAAAVHLIAAAAAAAVHPISIAAAAAAAAPTAAAAAGAAAPTAAAAAAAAAPTAAAAAAAAAPTAPTAAAAAAAGAAAPTAATAATAMATAVGTALMATIAAAAMASEIMFGGCREREPAAAHESEQALEQATQELKSLRAAFSQYTGTSLAALLNNHGFRHPLLDPVEGQLLLKYQLLWFLGLMLVEISLKFSLSRLEELGCDLCRVARGFSTDPASLTCLQGKLADALDSSDPWRLKEFPHLCVLAKHAANFLQALCSAHDEQKERVERSLCRIRSAVETMGSFLEVAVETLQELERDFVCTHGRKCIQKLRQDKSLLGIHIEKLDEDTCLVKMKYEGDMLSMSRAEVDKIGQTARNRLMLAIKDLVGLSDDSDDLFDAKNAGKWKLRAVAQSPPSDDRSSKDMKPIGKPDAQTASKFQLLAVPQPPLDVRVICYSPGSVEVVLIVGGFAVGVLACAAWHWWYPSSKHQEPTAEIRQSLQHVHNTMRSHARGDSSNSTATPSSGSGSSTPDLEGPIVESTRPSGPRVTEAPNRRSSAEFLLATQVLQDVHAMFPSRGEIELTNLLVDQRSACCQDVWNTWRVPEQHRKAIEHYVTLFFAGLVLVKEEPRAREVASQKKISFTRHRMIASTFGQFNPHYDRLQVMERLGNELYSLGKDLSTEPQHLDRVQRELADALDGDPRIFEILTRRAGNEFPHMLPLVRQARTALDALCSIFSVNQRQESGWNNLVSSLQRGAAQEIGSTMVRILFNRLRLI